MMKVLICLNFCTVDLMEGIKKAKTISSINFTKCGLTWQSMEALSSVIKVWNGYSSQRYFLVPIDDLVSVVFLL